MECAGRALSFWSYQVSQDLYVLVLSVTFPAGDMLTSMTLQNLGGSPLQSLDYSLS